MHAVVVMGIGTKNRKPYVNIGRRRINGNLNAVTREERKEY